MFCIFIPQFSTRSFPIPIFPLVSLHVNRLGDNEDIALRAYTYNITVFSSLSAMICLIDTDEAFSGSCFFPFETLVSAMSRLRDFLMGKRAIVHVRLSVCVWVRNVV